MATLASKVATAKGFSLVPTTTKILGVATVSKVSACMMHSKTSGLMEPLKKPWNYRQWTYSYPISLIDGTTKRFTPNTKMVVIEGPPAVGKTKFAKEFAEEFGMKYVPGFSMDYYYKNAYGYDLRELDHKFHYIRNKSYDEKKFAQDPMGQDGGLDRMLYTSYVGRYMQWVDQLGHLFNTGEGIVLERSPFSDFAYIEAAYSQGWIDRSSRKHYWKIRNLVQEFLLQPNLIIYLDVPIDLVQKNIRARAQTTHPWEKNSPVYENTEYLSHLYNDLFKKQYLPAAAQSSYVLTYDWSEGGDSEVVCEDVERLEMDLHDKYDKQQKDWRLHTEDGFASKREMYSGATRNQLVAHFCAPFWSADKLILSSAEASEADVIRARLPGNKYLYGYNTEIGDPEPFFTVSNKVELTGHDVNYSIENSHSNPQLEHEDRVRANKKALGDEDWWKL